MTADNPNIWIYRDARAYVGDLIAYRTATERGFSIRKLVRLAELGSPSYIRMYLDGSRNLRPATADRLADALGLRGDAAQFFVLLTQFTQSDDPDERLRHYEQMLHLAVRNGANRLDAARLAYFTEWYVPVVHAMGSLGSFRPDAEWIGRTIVPTIARKSAQRALDILFELGIFALDEDGRFTVRERVLETDPEVRGLWIREYHRAMIRLSERALDLLASDERFLRGFTVTLPSHKVSEVHSWLQDTMKSLFYRILELQKGMAAVEGEVVQCNLQFFPLTDVQQRLAKGERR